MSFIPVEQVSVRSHRPVSAPPRLRLPSWFKVNVRQGARSATFLILGDICTRRCHYCAVTTGRPEALDADEPIRVAEAVKALGEPIVRTGMNTT